MADNRDEALARAEAKFKRQEDQKRESETVWAERAAAGRAADELRAKLKSQRLAKEDADDRARGDAISQAGFKKAEGELKTRRVRSAVAQKKKAAKPPSGRGGAP